MPPNKRKMIIPVDQGLIKKKRTQGFDCKRSWKSWAVNEQSAVKTHKQFGCLIIHDSNDHDDSMFNYDDDNDDKYLYDNSSNLSETESDIDIDHGDPDENIDGESLKSAESETANDNNINFESNQPQAEEELILINAEMVSRRKLSFTY